MSVEERLPDALQGLVALGARGDVNIRPILLRVLTDMFIAKAHHSSEEIHQYSEIASQMLRNMDVDTCRIVAQKLARFDQAPKPILGLLVAAGGPPAEIILSQSPSLGRPFLVAEAAFGSASNAASIAARMDLDADLAAILAHRREAIVLQTLADNATAPIESGTFSHLIRRARTDANLARALIARAPTGHDLSSLFLAASPPDRAKIILSIRRRELGRPEPAPTRPASAHTLASLEQLALAGERHRFVLCLANALTIEPDQAAIIVDDAYGEPLALALAALRVPVEIAVRLFLFIDPRIGQSVERVRSLVRIVRHMPPHLCRRLLTAMMAGRSPSTYVPVYDSAAAQTPSRGSTALTVRPPLPAVMRRKTNAMPS
jgi:uncharacterized protein (DUF2336 family)